MQQNKNLGQAGFGHIAVLLVVVIVTVIGFVGWTILKSNKNDTTQKQTTTQQSSEMAEAEADIVLQNIGLSSIDDIDITTQATREFKSHGLKGFYIFGDTLKGGRTNPNFEYASLKSGTKIISATDGIVAFIKEQSDSSDSEVFIQPKEGSAWTVGYDHVVNITVKKGDTIKAGAVIGEPAVQNNGLTRFEIQINKDENGITTHYCPSVLLATSVKDKIVADLTAMQNKWESVTGLELYDVAKQSPVGCTKATMTSTEAESAS